MTTLKEVIFRAFPDHNSRIADVAAAIEVSKSTLEHWFHTNRLPPARAHRIIKLSVGRLTIEDFKPFLAKGRGEGVGNSPLAHLIARGLPQFAYQPKRIAGAVNREVSGAYEWFRSDRIPADCAQQLVDLSEGRLTLDDFAPFLPPETPCNYQTGDLWRVVSKACGDRWPNANALAAAIGLHAEGVRSWFVRGAIPYRRAMRLVELSEGKLRFDQLQPFVS